MNSIVYLLFICFFVDIVKAGSIIIEPNIIYDGQMRDINITCSFSQSTTPGLSTLFSVLLSHSLTMDEAEFRPLASINVLDQKINAGSLEKSATVSGFINSSGESLLHLSWKNPKSDKSGLYRCSFTGVSVHGYPLTLTSTDAVVTCETDHVDLTQKVTSLIGLAREVTDKVDIAKKVTTDQIDLTKKVTTDQIELTKQVTTDQIDVTKNITTDNVKLTKNDPIDRIDLTQKVTDHVDLTQNVADIEKMTIDLYIKFDTLRNQAAHLQAAHDSLLLRLNRSRDAAFHVSPSFNGSRYYLPKFLDFFMVTWAQSTCELYGGYLAEINGKEELHFLRNFLQSKSSFDVVVLGGTDEEAEGQWVHLRDRSPVTFLTWAAGQPNDGRVGNCLCLWKDVNWYMADSVCAFYNRKVSDPVYGYLCEIPEQSG